MSRKVGIANAKEVGIERVKMVLDGGFWSEECLKSLKDSCEAFTIGMPVYLKESEKILASHGGDRPKTRCLDVFFEGFLSIFS